MTDFLNTELWLDFLMPLTRLVFAALCGALIGYERERQRKSAGLRTHALVAIGACLFSIIGLRMHAAVSETDLLRLLQGLLIGTGFIAGGVIFREGPTVRGLTTAAGLWVIAAIGMASGVGEYYLAAAATVLTFLTFTALHKLEGKLKL